MEFQPSEDPLRERRVAVPLHIEFLVSAGLGDNWECMVFPLPRRHISAREQARVLQMTLQRVDLRSSESSPSLAHQELTENLLN
jgi:hypothetical protein